MAWQRFRGAVVGDSGAVLRRRTRDGDTWALRLLALWSWSYAVWVLLLWTLTAEVLATGAVVCLATAVALAWTGPVAGPWVLLRPRTALGLVHVVTVSTARIVRANLTLTRLIWRRRPAPHSGMVVVPTHMRTGAAVGATGLLSSLAVDNQITDVDLRRHELLYHVVEVTRGAGYESVNGPTERLLKPLVAPQEDARA